MNVKDRGMQQKKKTIRFSIWYLLAAMLIVLLLNSLLTAPQETTIDYSKFKDLLAENRIKEATIEQERIRGKAFMTDGKGEEEKAFVTIRVEDPELVSELRQHEVTFSGRRENTFLNSLVAWVLPLLLFIGIWVFLMRRMGRGPEFMSVGRSKAKILAEDQLDVTFNDVAGVDEAKEELKEIVEFLKDPKNSAILEENSRKGSYW
jgi:cell division protease FtsH